MRNRCNAFGQDGSATVRPHSYLKGFGIERENLSTIRNMLNHKSLAHTAIHDRLSTTAVDRVLRAQAGRLCGLLVGVEGNSFNQAQLENREIAMLTQG